MEALKGDLGCGERPSKYLNHGIDIRPSRTRTLCGIQRVKRNRLTWLWEYHFSFSSRSLPRARYVALTGLSSALLDRFQVHCYASNSMMIDLILRSQDGRKIFELPLELDRA